MSKLLSEKFKEWTEETERRFQTIKANEIELNKIFIDLYGLKKEITPIVNDEDITIRRADLNRDIKSLISYAIGCMFGRYSLDKPGLILANQGDTLQDYLKQIPEPKFMPTESNVIPVLDGDWFPDEVVNRFREFLEITYGQENFDENLRFIETALGKDLRRYFLRDFYKDHLQTYKKRPIYWLFSSPRGNFNALIYMHRYQPETVGIILNQYLREYCQKLEAQREYQESIAGMAGHSARERSAATREAERLLAVLAELRDYEDQVLFPLASKRLEIDLDDGVVVNYAKFGKALQKI